MSKLNKDEITLVKEIDDEKRQLEDIVSALPAGSLVIDASVISINGDV